MRTGPLLHQKALLPVADVDSVPDAVEVHADVVECQSVSANAPMLKDRVAVDEEGAHFVKAT